MAVIHKLSLSLSHAKGVDTINVKNGSTEDVLIVSFYSNGSPFNIEKYTAKLITNKTGGTRVYVVGTRSKPNSFIFRINEPLQAKDYESEKGNYNFLNNGWNICEIELYDTQSRRKTVTQNFQIYEDSLASGRKYYDDSGLYMTEEDIRRLRELDDSIEVTGLPEVGEGDNGKFLRVVNGVWSATNITDVSEVGA